MKPKTYWLTMQRIMKKFVTVLPTSNRKRRNCLIKSQLKMASRSTSTINAPVKPNFIGSETFTNYPLETLVEYFDWTPFFISWSLAGKFPKILEDEVVGEAARDLYEQAQAMLKDIIENKRFDARATFSIYPANRVAADTVAVADETWQCDPQLRALTSAV